MLVYGETNSMELPIIHLLKISQHFMVHKSPPLGPILSQINPVPSSPAHIWETEIKIYALTITAADVS
jgi:hypothetical protein